MNNPVDVLATAGAEHFRAAMDALMDDEGIDSIFMTVVTPFFVDNEAVAREIAAVNREGKKPVIVNLMTDRRQWTGPANILTEGGVPFYSFPETAARALVAMTEYARLKARKPGALAEFADLDAPAAAKILEEASASKTGFLSQEDAYRLLEAYKIPVVPYSVVASAEEAASEADRLSYPVTIKVDCEEVLHKSDAGGLALDVRDRARLNRPVAGLSACCALVPGLRLGRPLRGYSALLRAQASAIRGYPLFRGPRSATRSSFGVRPSGRIAGRSGASCETRRTAS